MIQNGELVYVFNEHATFLIPFQEKSSFSCHKGDIKFTPGLDWGDSVTTPGGDIFYLLHPTMADIMMKVKRRTTIIYPKEAGVILLELGVQNGTKMIEIGTGSGSLTLLLTRLVGSEGKVYSFERRAEHQEIAIKNVKRMGVPDNVEFILKDPVTDGGFGLENMDCIFVDVPAPWNIIPHAYRALKSGGHIGVLSPNIEQVQTTVTAMEETGFVRIRTVETIQRGIRVKKNLTRPFDRMIAHTGYLYFAQKANVATGTRHVPEYCI
jgi:tRNA (adenine57-N1/adenine58-N1)-methyltransferase